MWNLIIGLCLGMAACGVLLILWRMADGLRDQIDRSRADPDDPKGTSEHLRTCDGNDRAGGRDG